MRRDDNGDGDEDELIALEAVVKMVVPKAVVMMVMLEAVVMMVMMVMLTSRAVVMLVAVGCECADDEKGRQR